MQNAEDAERGLSLQVLAADLQITASQAADLVDELEKRQLIAMADGLIQLTSSGRSYAMQIIRAHRLWESFLAEKTGFAASEWHQRADIREHMLSPEEADELSAQLGYPRFDPHGDPIPSAEGELERTESQALANLGSDEIARIVHIEDEPDSIAAQILAEELEPGMLVQHIEVAPHQVRFWSNGEEHVLAPIVAANISVKRVQREIPDEQMGSEKLSALKKGESAEVVRISPACRGAERRRLMDLGILPGALVETEFKSPGGDPTAYRIRGAVIALREEQAKLIGISRLVEAS